MKKRIFAGMTLAGLAALGLASCGQDKEVFHIYAWNDEFQLFFEKYLSEEKVPGTIADPDDSSKKIRNPEAPDAFHLDGVEVKWTITPSSEGQYKNALKLALEQQDSASASEKVDMFLAESDYIHEMTADNYTIDISSIGVTGLTQIYNYTKQAASNDAGVTKGVSFQCCPSALIYNRKVAKEVFGSDDQATVQAKVKDWATFNQTAVEVAAKGFYMTASESDSYRVFSNNASTAWVNNDVVQIPAAVESWMTQADDFVKKGYTVAADIWSDDKTNNFKADDTLGTGDNKGASKAFCTFGPAWYYNFCMGKATKGDWMITTGPQAHFWGGTWLMAPKGGNNDALTAKVMKAFTTDETVLTNLVKKENQFTNNQKVNADIAAENDLPENKGKPGFGSEILGYYNDTKFFLELAKNVVYANACNEDQTCNEGLQEKYREYLKGTVDKATAINNFYTKVIGVYSYLKKPAA